MATEKTIIKNSKGMFYRVIYLIPIYLRHCYLDVALDMFLANLTQ